MCWEPCFRAARPGTAFCDSCWRLLAVHRSLGVRYAVVSRPDTPRPILDVMSEDMDAQVQWAAAERIAELDDEQFEITFV